jgi:hypothetical protein
MHQSSEVTSLHSLKPWQVWIALHDHSLVFAALYVSLTILLSVFISYFWLAALIGVHIALEYLKKGYLRYPKGKVHIVWTLWDIKYDLALLCLATVLASYTGLSAGAAGAQSLSRISRMNLLVRYWKDIVQFFKSLGKPVVDTVFSARVVLFRKADMQRARTLGIPLNLQVEREQASFEVPQALPWKLPLTKGDWFALGVIALNLSALIAAPWFTSHSYATLVNSLGAQFHPWPF